MAREVLNRALDPAKALGRSWTGSGIATPTSGCWHCCERKAADSIADRAETKET
jgi:hypothetical protein